jgi:hypothetical protein
LKNRKISKRAQEGAATVNIEAVAVAILNTEGAATVNIEAVAVAISNTEGAATVINESSRTEV